AGSASITTRPGTIACALATANPARRPSTLACASSATISLRPPLRPARTSGPSGRGDPPPEFLLRRSVGHLGRKSDTTLFIAGLHFERCTFPAPAPEEFDQPARPAKAGNRQRRRRKRTNPPAR